MKRKKSKFYCLTEYLKEKNGVDFEISFNNLRDELVKRKNNITFAKSYDWSDYKSAIVKSCLQAGYIVSSNENTLTFKYNYTTADAILNGKGMIILNNMYTGRYISSWGNLGHEAINLIRADKKQGKEKGKFYIWLNSMGVCTEQIDKNEGCTVLMVRSINSTKYKVIAKAIGCRLCEGAETSRTKKNSQITDEEDPKTKRYEKQINLATYDGINAIEIYAPEKDMFATFCADEVLETSDDVYLITKDAEEKEDKSNHIYQADFKISEAMRAYIGVNHKANTTLKSFLEEDIWKPISANNTQKIKQPEFNFFKLIRKDRDELALSNALAYFISKIKIETFLKADFLNLGEEIPNDKYKMFREKNNIDISFFGEKNVVIIENKIDAGITANATDKIQKQIDDAVKLYHDETKFTTETEYRNAITCVVKQICPEIFSTENVTHKKRASQLSKYYIYAIAYLLNKEGIKPEEIQDHIKCFILIPEYYVKSFKMSDFYLSDKYKEITYKNISEFFDKTDNTTNIDDEGKKYLEDFKSVLKSLAKEFDNELEEEMKSRFFKTIEEIKNSKKMSN